MIDMPLPLELFDAANYLARNPDVMAATNGDHDAAFQHYMNHGFREELRGDRQRSLPTTSQYLIDATHPNPDVYERLITTELEKRALLNAIQSVRRNVNHITLDMIAEDVRNSSLPRLDQNDIDETELTADQLHWRKNGFLIKEGLLPNDLIENYIQLRSRIKDPGGWSCPVPYMHFEEIRDLCLFPPILDIMKSLIGEDMGVHLNLTGWVTTGRNWHQDDYLNPPYVNSWYCAVWMALDDIDPDCGPFEFVPTSNWWPLTRSHMVKVWMDPADRERIDWPKVAEGFVNDLFDREVEERKIPTKRFIAKKGDVLFWHGRLLHRGTVANRPGMMRKSLIAHYSGINHRPDMPNLASHNGRPYFSIPLPIDQLPEPK